MSRRVYSGECTVRFACSICGLQAEYPLNMRYDTDGNFVCFRHAQTENALDESRKRASARQPADEATLPGPLGSKPSWEP